MRTFIKIILWLLSILVSLLLILTCYFVIGKNKSIFGYSSFINTGTSMLPTIEVGDLLIIKECDSYEIEDIITFENNEGYIITHRVKEVSDNGYITKGDNNSFIDGDEVNKAMINGKLIYRIKFVGIVLNYILNNKLMIIIGFLVLVVFGLVLKYVC